MKKYESWGRYPKASHTVQYISSGVESLPAIEGKQSVLPYAQGRSYGDSCLNNGGMLLDTSGLNQVLAFDEENGVLRCEGGTTLDTILDLIVPKGWFLPIVPGTKFISVGGALANDIHGKNHHCEGTLGSHVLQFELLRSDGSRRICSSTQNPDWFESTIGGLGLTGLIVWAEFSLKPIKSSMIAMESIKFNELTEFFCLSEESDQDYEYIVAWMDCLSKGSSMGRGIFMRGNHAENPNSEVNSSPQGELVNIAFDAPDFLLNSWSIQIFNFLYFHKHLAKRSKAMVHYNQFFFPLDIVGQWNRLYGKRGFLQYQCVVPFDEGYQGIFEIIREITDSGLGSFLTVIKIFGDKRSPGVLSFPRKGVTLAIDFPNKGTAIFTLLEKLDKIVRKYGGSVYPAKDARMSPENFKEFFPQWQEFIKFIDPAFSSSFWRRVMRDNF